MTAPLLKSKLAPVAGRQRRFRLARALAVFWAAAALATWLLVLIQRGAGWQWPWLVPWLGAVAAVVTFIVWRRIRRWEPDYRDIARRIEVQHPELHALLLTAVEQQPDAATGRLNFLQERVIAEAVDASRKHSWIDAVSNSRLLGVRFARLAALVLLILGLVQLHRVPAEAHTRHGRTTATLSDKVTVTNSTTNSSGSVTVPAGGGSVTVTLSASIPETDSMRTDLSVA